MGGLRAGVCLAQWSSFTHPERGREREREEKGESERESRVLDGQGLEG